MTNYKTLFLAGGCFWGVEAYFQQIEGVLNTGVGYAQGHVEEPTYQQVSSGNTGHTETVMISYDPTILELTTLLDHFFRIINPYSLNKQGNDVGTQYRSGIYYAHDEDLSVILNYVKALQKQSDQQIVVEVKTLENYYRAEEYHQHYLDNNPGAYCHIDLSLLNDHEKKPAN
ncbi:peptide-methionine (S)-S-oxide reductase MsrA [Erysipelothrix urinaevulpis]|uniref:peptide-methionine (S)-S-oxide reductase MsrA n=1 Tax=Erysipelothrix urinaevulpis TaxID=2683717 RepID=UPI00135AC6A6|nr:peptide-methionine (S)-S-oxide reductase MsrA [Erysipelothrix urinaevulpis]